MRSFILLALFASMSANAASKTAVICEKDGKNGQPEFAFAKLEFTVLEDAGSTPRALQDLRGEIRAAYSLEEIHDSSNDSPAYIGEFSVANVLEDLKYKPRKYLNSSRFPLNAHKTRGAESGMWGDLILTKDLSPSTFEAHYIFKAGDHMGGTIHMSCRKN